MLTLQAPAESLDLSTFLTGSVLPCVLGGWQMHHTPLTWSASAERGTQTWLSHLTRLVFNHLPGVSGSLLWMAFHPCSHAGPSASSPVGRSTLTGVSLGEREGSAAWLEEVGVEPSTNTARWWGLQKPAVHRGGGVPGPPRPASGASLLPETTCVTVIRRRLNIC